MSKERRSQAERRAETQAAILQSATRLFGEKGYNDTSLEDIASDCGISIAPIYHYYKNKQNLFLAVSDRIEEQLLTLDEDDQGVDRLISGWQNFLKICADPHFRRIVLIDGPNVLGRDRIYSSNVSSWAQGRMRKRFNAEQAIDYKPELIGRMLMVALGEAGLFVGNAEDPEQAAKDASEIVEGLAAMLAAMKKQK